MYLFNYRNDGNYRLQLIMRHFILSMSMSESGLFAVFILLFQPLRFNAVLDYFRFSMLSEILRWIFILRISSARILIFTVFFQDVELVNTKYFTFFSAYRSFIINLI